ncbi:MAG TPA: hypothetical protein VKD67_02765, partial [Acidimicrobiales bacterium]|nr:hypothetical protein [Acidimicrobiales bacterium]
MEVGDVALEQRVGRRQGRVVDDDAGGADPVVQRLHCLAQALGIGGVTDDGVDAGAGVSEGGGQ